MMWCERGVYLTHVADFGALSARSTASGSATSAMRRTLVVVPLPLDQRSSSSSRSKAQRDIGVGERLVTARMGTLGTKWPSLSFAHRLIVWQTQFDEVSFHGVWEFA